MTEFTLLIQTTETVPTDVLVEHVAACLKNWLKPDARERKFNVSVVGVREPRKHPFDGPEVFDDERAVTPAPDNLPPTDNWAAGGIIPGDSLSDYDIRILRGLAAPVEAISDAYPRIKELYDARRAERELKRPLTGPTEPLGEGEWDLPHDDQVGED